MTDDEASVIDMLQSAEIAGQHVDDMTREQFMVDVKTQDAVLRRLTVLGEAAKRVSAEFRDEHSEVPWSAVAGTRDRVMHGYNSVDLSIVWDIVSNDLRDLIGQLSAITERFDERE